MVSYVNEETMAAMYRNDPQVCSDCGKQEDVGGTNRFSVCSGCKTVYYCSKDCQRNHWKIHKRICKQKKRKWTAEDKLQDFENQFHPLMSMLTVSALQPYKGNDNGRSSWLGDTHFLMVELTDTPPNSPVALQIESYFRCKISNQPEPVQAIIRHYQQEAQNRKGPNDASAVALCEYGECRHYPMGFLNLGLFSHPTDEDYANLPKAVQARQIQDRVASFKLQINAMATGVAKGATAKVEKARTA